MPALKAVYNESARQAARGPYASSSKGYLSRFGSNLKRNIKTSDILGGLGAIQEISSEADLYSKFISGRSSLSLERGETNALIAEGNIESVKRSYEMRAARLTDTFNRLAGTQLAKFSKGGIDPGLGTPAIVMDETRLIGEIEAASIRYAGFEAVENLRLQAAFARLDAKSERARLKLNEQLNKIQARAQMRQIAINAIGNIAMAGAGSSG